MDVDLELYRREVTVSTEPRVRLSVIDIAPEHYRHTFVLIHGYAGYARQWQYQLREFSGYNRVIAFDQRGHGQSDKPDSSYSMDEVTEDIAVALDALNVDGQVVLVGHSFGGAVVTEFATRYPERVSHLILIATSGEFRLNALYRLLLRMPVTFHRVIAPLFAAVPILRKWLGAPPVVLKRWNDNNLARWNGWSLFRDLRVPTLVIRGHRDRLFSQTFFEEVARTIPTAEEINVGASGHMVQLERRDAVNRAIGRFLETSASSWRGAESNHSEASIYRTRPWVDHYENGVPYTIAVPDVPLHNLLRSAERRFANQAAIIYEGRKISYRQLNQEVNRFANGLRSLGVDKGDRVMLLLPNIPQMLIGFFGTLKAGGVAVFSLPFNQPEELIRQINDSGARILVTVNQFGALAVRALAETELEMLVCTNLSEYLPWGKKLALQFNRRKREALGLHIETEACMYAFADLVGAHSSEAPEVAVESSDLAAIIYTGGTTAAPKGVMLSHRNLVANTLQTRHWMPDAVEGRERFLCVLPFTHAYGMTAAMLVPIALGATLILKPNFDVLDTLKSIKKYKPTIFPGVPSMYVTIGNFPGVRAYGSSSVKACISGSAPLPVEVQESFEKLTRGRLVEGYGLTEAGPVTHANPLHGLRKIGTIGVPLPSTEAKVVFLTDPEQEISDGQIGELAVRGPQVMQGYWNNPKATGKALLPDGWLLTGDVVQQDEQGYFRIIARKADMWYPGKPGEPAFPRDIEEVLFEVPQVKEAAVVAIAGQPVAFVIAKSKQDQPTAKKLIAYCERRLPPEMVPRLIIFVDDFPRTFIGKVLRRELAKRYQQLEHQRTES